MKTLKTLFVVLAVAMLTSVGWADFSTSFESSEGYALGGLNGQQGWGAYGARATNGQDVVNDRAHSGSQSVKSVPNAAQYSFNMHTVNGPLSGNDVDVIWWTYFTSPPSGPQHINVFGFGSDINDQSMEIMYSTSGDFNSPNWFASEAFTSSPYYTYQDTGVAVVTDAWIRVRVRFIWDSGAGKYTNYGAWYNAGAGEVTIVDPSQNYGGWWGHLDPAHIDSVLIGNWANGDYVDDLSVTLVPEPVTLALLTVGGALTLIRRRR